MSRWLETDTQTNINIAAATAIASYTADATRLIMAQVFLRQVAGGGDYIFYVTIQLSGGGAIEHVVLPKTTGTAAAGETSLAAQSILVPMRLNDVMIVYVKGLAGDIATPDTEVRFFELGENDLLVDEIWDEPLTGATHNVATSSGRRLRQLADVVIHDGTAAGATDNTITLDGGASAVDGAYDPALIYIATGVGAGQCRLILQYDGATRTAVVDRNWKVNPNAASTFVIVGDAGREHVNEGLAQGGGVQSITLNPLASTENDAYIGQVVFIRSGTGEDQARRVEDYDGMTKIALVSRPWGIIPDATSGYVMLPTGAISDACIANAVWDASMAAHVTPGTTGAKLNSIPIATVFPAGAIEYTYTVTDIVTGFPIEGVEVWITTDIVGLDVVWKGDTDAFGVAMDVNGEKPWLDAGDYYFWCQKAGYSFTNPDLEHVS